jgi:hypothetical protein
MAEHEIIQRLRGLDVLLVAKGFPAITPWWFNTLSRFYDSGKMTLALRVGRRGGKSSTLSRVAVVESLYGKHVIAPGDVGVVPIVSVNRQEAAERIRLIKTILDTIKVKWKPVDGGVELLNKNRVFKVFSASIGGVSGFSCICALCDEVSKWKDVDKGSNPATEVLASLRPTFAGQTEAKLFLSSSPMGRADAHAKAVDDGDTKHQMVAIGQTWIVRPNLTEEMCHALEPDPAVFMREYGCIPFDGSTSSLFTEEGLLGVTRQDEELAPEPGVTYFAFQDPASRANAWTLAIAKAVYVKDDTYQIDVVKVREWRAPLGGVLDSDVVFGEIAETLKPYRVTDLHSDQWSFDPLEVVARRHRLNLIRVMSSATTKVQTYEHLKRRVDDKTVSLPAVDEVRTDLCGVRKWISRAGAFSMELEKNGRRHSDFAPSVAGVVLKAAEDSAEPSFVDATKAWRASGGAVTNFE